MHGECLEPSQSARVEASGYVISGPGVCIKLCLQILVGDVIG